MTCILVVEDEDPIRLLIRRVLQSKGYEVMEAANGKIALTMLQARMPDLVLTDLNMPQLNGLQLIEQIRHSSPDLPIVVISAFTEHIEEAREKGIQTILRKPFTYHQLLAVLDHLLPP